MTRQFRHWISGLALYGLLSTLVGLSIFWHMPGTGTLALWLGSSANPQMALIYFSLLMGGVAMAFLRLLGFEFPFFKFHISEDVKRYIAGLPIWSLFLLIAFSAVGLARFTPTCHAPEAVYFEIVGSGARYQPMDVMRVQPGQSFSIAAISPNKNAQLSCLSWEFVGPAFEKMGEKAGCQVNVRFSRQSGVSFITLVTTQEFCAQKSIFSLEVRVEEP